MKKSEKSKAEKKFAAILNKCKPILTEDARKVQERAEKAARLKSVRLASEATDRVAAVQGSSDRLVKNAVPALVHSPLECDDSDLLEIPQFLRRME